MLQENTMFVNDGRILKNLDKKYKKSSIKTIQSRVRNLYQNAFNTNKFKLSLLERVDDILEYTMTQASASSTFNSYYQIYRLSRDPKQEILEEYETILKELKKQDKEQNTFKKANEEEQENTITKEGIIKLRNDYDELIKNTKDKNFIKYNIRRLVLYLYSELPPLRSQDYIHTKYTDQEEFNFMDLENSVLKIKGGKVQNSIRNIEIPSELLEVIKQTKDNVKSDFLIPKIRDLNNNMKNDTFTHFVNNIFEGKKISSTKLRNLFVSDLIDKNANAETRKNIAKTMGHSIDTQNSVYTKYSKVLHNQD